VPAAPLLDPKTLASLGHLQLRARRVVEGVLTGLHRSARQGQAVEFAEHKEYAPGDEIRHIDWRVYARADKHYVKKFEVETDLRAWVVVDASASMAYGRDRPSKLEVAKMLAASLAYLFQRQQDRVGLVIAGGDVDAPSAAREAALVTVPDEAPFDGRLPDGLRRYLPPGASQAHLQAFTDTLEKTVARGATSLAPALDFVAEQARRRALVFLVSDLFDPTGESLRALSRLRARKCEVTAFHVLDPDELDFPFEDPTEFVALEGDARVEANPAAVKAGYLQELRAFLADTSRTLRRADVEYALVRTDAPLDGVLLEYAAGRRTPGRGS